MKTRSFFGDIIRTETDLNRPEGRDETFRQKIRDEFSKTTAVIDCHTSPKSAFEDGTDVMVLISGKGLNKRLGHEMADRLEERGLNVELKAAKKVNDIVEEAHRKTAGALLLEFNPSRPVKKNAAIVGSVLCDMR